MLSGCCMPSSARCADLSSRINIGRSKVRLLSATFRVPIAVTGNCIRETKQQQVNLHTCRTDKRRSRGSGPLRSRAAPIDFKPTGFTAVTKQQRTTTLFRPGSNTSPPSDLQLALRASPVSAGPTSHNPDTAGSTSHSPVTAGPTLHNPGTAGSTSHISPSTLAIGPNADHASSV